MGLSDYEEMLTNVITQEDIVSGSGIWFAPYAYDSNEKYVGPYVYKDGSSTVITYDYSNAEYDYVSQEYYTIAESSTEPVITDPYYDPTSDTIMSTCTAPIIADGKFIGCVSVDIILSTITDMIDSIVVGEAGSAVSLLYLFRFLLLPRAYKRYRYLPRHLLLEISQLILFRYLQKTSLETWVIRSMKCSEITEISFPIFQITLLIL